MTTMNEVLEKYGDIIKEEVNVKELSALWGDIQITKIFKPIGSQLSAKFGKDTGMIIKNGKAGNIEELDNGQVRVFDDNGSEWILDNEDYEIAYQGLEGDDIAAEGDIIAKLSLEITPELEQEGIAREISRFINQMRKDADYSVDDKVALIFDTEHDNLKTVIDNFGEFLQSEALVRSIDTNNSPEWDIVAIFDYEEQAITFALKK